MSVTKKLDQSCAFRMEAGKTKGDSGWAWNGSTIMSLGADNGMPYTEKDIKITPEYVQDESVEGVAFKEVPIMTGLGADFSIGGNVSYDGLDRLFYWMFGYEDGGTSPVNLGGGYYQHLFELDKKERHYSAYRTEEQTAGDYASTDRKNRSCTFAFKKGTNDFRYPHVMCKSFRFSSEASAGLLKWNATGIPPKESRGNYSSSTWTIPTALQNAAYVKHRDFTISLKAQGGAYTTLAASSFDIECEIPLSIVKDTVSGLYIAEPVFSGRYNVKVSLTLSRFSADTYLDYRDDWTGAKLAMKLMAASGSYGFELYLPEMRISDSSASEDDVATNPITFECGAVDADTANIFATEIGSGALIEKGPLFLITKNKNSVNEMRRE